MVTKPQLNAHPWHSNLWASFLEEKIGWEINQQVRNVGDGDSWRMSQSDAPQSLGTSLIRTKLVLIVAETNVLINTRLL